MTLQHVNIGTVSKGEMPKLTLAQILVLAAWRQTNSIAAIAETFGKDVHAVEVMLYRIKRAGVRLSAHAA